VSQTSLGWFAHSLHVARIAMFVLNVQDEMPFPPVEHIYIRLMLLPEEFMNSVFVAAYESVDTNL
jgi:hypothetical protein